MSHLVVFDLDGTLTRQRGGFELLHTLYGTTPEAETLMDRFEAGQITFAEWCRGAVDVWRANDVTRSDITRATRAVKPKAGAVELLEHLQQADIRFGILSAGVANLATQFDPYDPAFVHGNWIQFEDDRVSGIDVHVGPDEKGKVLRKIRVEQGPTSITYIGDSHTDTEAFIEADTAVLFDPDERIPEAAIDAADTVIECEDIAEVQTLLPAI
ncbi:phosphoserine phosphatase [Haloarcula sp. CBA1130]|uniref:HAD family hydrolase n=1 Tax=unclassified Haloarcula TaxID=2624677 RepID=UPI001247B362|nr:MULTISPECIES: HAD-IB family phosphatase [unclassified Haloarcula]KAA9395920.1 phosphoserine phosphatase [Haloarcula sp. CBA1129]KAA9400151.1 phosphoserine phosphatase [Haloarcula sp. CBA1130]